MDISINNDWDWAGDDYKIAFASTSDPRVVAVIQREEEYGGGHIDGDCYAPAFYFDSNHPSHAGSTFMDSESEAIARAYENAHGYFVNRHYRHGGRQMDYDKVTARYMRIFHETHVESYDSSIDRNLTVYVFNTPTWREHVGFTGGIVAVDKEDWQAAIDGDAYGTGYAVYEERVTDEEPIDLLDGNWDIEITCWQMLGEDYAKGECFSYETPTLPTLLDFEPA